MENGFWASQIGTSIRYLLFIPAFIVGYLLTGAISNLAFKIFDNWFAGAIVPPALGMVLGSELASRVIPSKNKAAVVVIVCLFWLIMTYITFLGAEGKSLETRSIVIIISSLVGGIIAIKSLIFK